ncbi:MAG: S41 family peptidase [Pseudomonadota bacterium]
MEPPQANRYQSAPMAVATPEAAVLSAGITRISEVYFRPISLGDMTLDGLNALTALDHKLYFAVDRNWLTVQYGGDIIHQVTVPVQDQAEGWAQSATLALDAARRQSPRLAAIDHELVLETMFDAMTEKLDRFSRYASANNGSRERQLREGFGGVGLAFEHADNQFIIRSIFPDGPAFHAGLQNGDQITAIDGDRIDDLSITDVRDLLRGRVGSFVMVDVLRDGLQLEDLSLLRERVISNTVIGRVEDNIGVITIERFNAATEAHVRSAVATIKHKLGESLEGFVIDLRNNPGGLLEQAVSVSDLFITRGRIIRTAGRHPESFQSFAADDLDILDGVPIVVLINGGSASAAEVVAAALQETGRAVVVGSASYGKGSVQTVTRLPNDGELFVTWSEIFTPDGHGLHEIGILPNICTSDTDWRQTADGILLTDIVQRAKPTRTIWRNHTKLGHRQGMDHQMIAAIAEAGRQECPPNRETDNHDQDIALTLLKSPTLMAEISGVSATTIASRSPAIQNVGQDDTVIGNLR